MGDFTVELGSSVAFRYGFIEAEPTFLAALVDRILPWHCALASLKRGLRHAGRLHSVQSSVALEVSRNRCSTFTARARVFRISGLRLH